MAINRRAGVLYLLINGVQHDAKGSFTYNLGAPKRDALVGHDRVHGYKELPQVPMIEGEITDSATLKVRDLLNIEEATIHLKLANGKSFILRQAWYAGDGNVQSEEANIEVKFQGMSGEEI